MRAITFLRWCLAIPLAVPVIAVIVTFLVTAVSDQMLWMTQWTIILVYSLLIGGIPYLVFLFAVLFWFRYSDATALGLFSLVAPLVYAMFFLVLWAPVVLILDRATISLDQVFTLVAVYGAFCLGLGYVYVLLAHAAYALLRWRGIVDSAAAPTR